MPIVIGTGGSGSSSAASLTSYSGLIASVESWLNRDDLDALVPLFIQLTEERLNRILRVPEMEVDTTLSVSSGTSTLPTDFLEARHLYINADIDSEIVPGTMSQIRRDYGVSSDTGRPLIYAITDGAFHFGPSPDTTYSVVLHYYQKITALTTTNTSNWVLASHPSIYLFGCLMQAEFHGWNDERLPLIKAAWDEAIIELKNQGNSKRHGGGPIFPRPIARPGPRS